MNPRPIDRSQGFKGLEEISSHCRLTNPWPTVREEIRIGMHAIGLMAWTLKRRPLAACISILPAFSCRKKTIIRMHTIPTVFERNAFMVRLWEWIGMHGIGSVWSIHHESAATNRIHLFSLLSTPIERCGREEIKHACIKTLESL